VTDPLFQTDDFFDPDDVVQVKYEMLRRVRADKQSVSGSASTFGFSRPTYYQAEEDFQRDGLYGLLPEKRGPRQGHKLTPDVLDFTVQLRASDPSLRAVDLAAAIQQRFAITIHPRSIERALARKKNSTESKWRRTQNSRAASIDLCLRRSAAASRSMFQFWGLGHGPFSWPGNAGMDAGMLLGGIPQSPQLTRLLNHHRSFAE